MRVNKLDQEWYKPTGEDFKSELDKIHLARYRYMEVLCEGATVLDVGTGAGYGAYAVAATAKSVLGVDTDPAAISWARTMYADDNLEYRCCDFREVEEHFDIALCFGLMGLMQNLEDMRQIISEMSLLADVVVVDCPVEGTPVLLHYNELTREQWESVVAAYPGRVERFRQRGDRLGQSWDEDVKTDYYIAILSWGEGEHWGLWFPEKRVKAEVKQFSVRDAMKEFREFVPS